MVDFTLRLDNIINDKLDDISLKTNLLKTNLILFAINQYANNDIDLEYKYIDNVKFRTVVRMPETTNNYIDKRVKLLKISKNLYINTLVKNFIENFTYII